MGAGVITLNRPGGSNATTGAVKARLHEQLEERYGEDEVDAMIITRYLRRSA